MVGGFRISMSRLILCASAMLAALPLPAWPQEFPTRPVRIVVPLPPGGSNDLVARVFSDKLPAALGQPVIVENRAGGSGNPATEFVARSSPDGHTLLLANTAHVVNAGFFPALPYDPIKDFSAITLAYNVYFALVVNASLPISNTREFIDYTRAKPGALTYASSGIGAPHHMAMELLQSMTGGKLLHVPYKGAGQFVPAMLSGEIHSVIGAINSLLPHVKSGKLRALALAGERTSPLLPGIPTLGETVPGFNLDNWTGLLAPSATPSATIQRLNAEFVKVLRLPETIDRLTPQGIEIVASSPQVFQETLRTNLAKWTKLIREANIRID